MRVIITAGGTGGHIMPAMAIAEGIRDRHQDAKILYIGTNRGMEERIAGQFGIDFKGIDALGIKGKSPRHLARAAVVNVKALMDAVRIVRSFGPDWVVGTGGYVTGMVVLAGFLLGARCAIQEQNSVGGLTNRLLGRLAKKIFLAYPDVAGVFPKAKCILTGNPVRKSIARELRKDEGDYLLILGGSLGAASINDAAVKALRLLKNEGLALKVLHQTGAKDYEKVVQAYAEAGVEATVRDFIDDMAPVYAGARLALCRCGGLTLSEISVMGLPAVMVPFPQATDDHQMGNGRYVEAHGGGWVIPDDRLSPERLAMEIKERYFAHDMLRRAASDLISLELGNGSTVIAEEISGV
jgi:UDP-N-acetylglucosamine--N-acetylmuramyl-(pentapeptide) pyrophosphoryl-undecaprenol N-acetylglucosamine transferase